jgi:hypothetical protein
MSQEPGQDDSEHQEDWSDINFRGYTELPAVVDPDDLELPEPFAVPPSPAKAADAPESSTADDAG